LSENPFKNRLRGVQERRSSLGDPIPSGSGNAQNAPLKAAHLLSESAGISGRPTNVLEPTLPDVLSRVVIVLTFRWTEISTVSSFDW
jgi:hypothetical protein